VLSFPRASKLLNLSATSRGGNRKISKPSRTSLGSRILPTLVTGYRHKNKNYMIIKYSLDETKNESAAVAGSGPTAARRAPVAWGRCSGSEDQNDSAVPVTDEGLAGTPPLRTETDALHRRTNIQFARCSRERAGSKDTNELFEAMSTCSNKTPEI
jgi:hypothetical protein